MPQALRRYIRTQELTSAFLNAVINPTIAWLGDRQMQSVPVHALLTDTAVTSVILCLLVSLFVAAGTRREIAAGNIDRVASSSNQRPFVARLPRRAWVLGLALGCVAGVCLVTPLAALAAALRIGRVSFAGFALFKLVYTPVLASLVTRWVILRQIRTDPAP